jgi:hypothetical protein
MSGFQVQVVAHPRQLGTSARVYARKKIAHLARYAPRRCCSLVSSWSGWPTLRWSGRRWPKRPWR